MTKRFLLLIAFGFTSILSIAQNQPNVVYIVDSILVKEDPEEGNEVKETDIADVTVIKSKDSLQRLGFANRDGAIYIFTKEYRTRPEEIRRIPSSKQMENKNGVWHYRGSPYTGPFIDYFYNGRKQGEGSFKNGKVEGRRTMYHYNGSLSLERIYSNGIENGLEKEFYEDGSLKQKGEFLNGKENGVWEMYFPNGQVKQRSIFKEGKMEGETTVYYSTGKVLAVEITQNGKTHPDKSLEKINAAMTKGHESSRKQDYKNAVKHYSRAIELDTTYAEAYFARGTVKLNDFQFDAAIQDFDRALKYEPYFERALTNRAFARIRKHQFGNSRKLSESNGVTVMASKENPNMPENERTLICSDLKQAMFLGDRGRMIMEAYQQFCGK
jgi:antitoxin component YwqK of YwqJK toxin-antitoxin module